SSDRPFSSATRIILLASSPFAGAPCRIRPRIFISSLMARLMSMEMYREGTSTMRLEFQLRARQLFAVPFWPWMPISDARFPLQDGRPLVIFCGRRADRDRLTSIVEEIGALHHPGERVRGRPADKIVVLFALASRQGIDRRYHGKTEAGVLKAL